MYGRYTKLLVTTLFNTRNWITFVPVYVSIKVSSVHYYMSMNGQFFMSRDTFVFFPLTGLVCGTIHKSLQKDPSTKDSTTFLIAPNRSVSSASLRLPSHLLSFLVIKSDRPYHRHSDTETRSDRWEKILVSTNFFIYFVVSRV